MQRERLKREDREGGASMVIMDMRYIWSEIDSPAEMPKRRHPSRLVVLSRSIRCRKGSVEVGFLGGGKGREASTMIVCQPIEWRQLFHGCRK